MSIRQTHSYAVLEVSNLTYNEIAEKLVTAGYQHAFGPDGEIDMHGIAIAVEPVIRCEHGVPDGEWCEPCNKEMKRARMEQT